MRSDVECVVPILKVRDLPAAMRFYIDVLGFRLDWGGETGSVMCSVSRDGRSIMLTTEPQGYEGTWIWVGVEDVESLLSEFRTRGAKVVMEPTNFYWAYEIRIEDPDGNVLRIGSETKSDRPIA